MRICNQIAAYRMKRETSKAHKDALLEDERRDLKQLYFKLECQALEIVNLSESLGEVQKNLSSLNEVISIDD